MHLYAGMSECEELSTSACSYVFFCTQWAYSTIEMKQISHSFLFLPMLQVSLDLMMATGVSLYLLYLDLEIHYTQLHM